MITHEQAQEAAKKLDDKDGQIVIGYLVQALNEANFKLGLITTVLNQIAENTSVK